MIAPSTPYTLDLATLHPSLKQHSLEGQIEPITQQPMEHLIQESHKEGFPFVSAVVVEVDEANQQKVFLFDAMALSQKQCDKNPLSQRIMSDLTYMACLPSRRSFSVISERLFALIRDAKQTSYLAEEKLYFLAEQLKEGHDAEYRQYFMKQAAKRGHLKALLEMVQMQPFKKEKWLVKAAETKDPEAVFTLATFWSTKSATKQKAEELYFTAAFYLNHVESQYRYGRIKEIKKVYTLALKWYKSAAEQDHALAMYRLGYCYLMSCGVKGKQKEGIVLIERAANAGVACAMLQLAYCYKNGQSVEPSLDNYQHWLKAAASKGLLAAERELSGEAKTSLHARKNVAVVDTQAKVDALAESFGKLSVAETPVENVGDKNVTSGDSEQKDLDLLRNIVQNALVHQPVAALRVINDYLFYRNDETRFLIGKAQALRENYFKNHSATPSFIDGKSRNRKFLYASYAAARIVQMRDCFCRSNDCKTFEDCKTLSFIFGVKIEEVAGKIKRILLATYGTYDVQNILRQRVDAQLHKRK